MLYDHDSRRQLSREYQARLADDARRTRRAGRTVLVSAFLAAMHRTGESGRARRAAERLPALER